MDRRTFVKASSMLSLGFCVPVSWQFGKYPKSLAVQQLYAQFKHPPHMAKPFVRWWWNGLRLTEKELVRELDLLKDKGIGGVEINSIAFPEENDAHGYPSCAWLSDEWLNLLHTTLRAAKEREITCDIIVGSGWPFGGTFLERDEQIQLLTVGTKKLKGPGQYTIKQSELLAEMEALVTYKKGIKELFCLRLAPAELETFQAGTDLNSKLNEEVITLDLPTGEHVLYYLVKLTGYTAVTHGAPGASGPVLNHYNQAAVRKYLNNMSDALTSKIGRMGDHFRSVFIDSLELRGSNWCDDLLTAFKQRRGYDLEPYLPYILFKINRASTYNGGQIIEDDTVTRFSASAKEEINRVRYDFEITRLELFHERFLSTFTAWCRENGVQSRVQAYGREYYPLQSSMSVDIPECETWLNPDVGTDLQPNSFSKGRGYRPVNKFVSSAARLTGKKIVSCEEITNTAHVFNATLEEIKVTGDQSNLSGVTHSILHGFNYSPPDIPFPGWVRYGTFFNERNPWWPYLRTWIDYKARLSAVFQQAALQANIAILFPMADMWSTFGLQYQQWPQIVYPPYAFNLWEAIHQHGGGCDYIDEQILQQSRFLNRNMSYGDRHYQVLLMPEVETIMPESVECLRRFAAVGGTILFIGKKPRQSPGRHQHSAQDKQVVTAMEALQTNFPKNVNKCPAPQEDILAWYREVHTNYRLPSYIEFDSPVAHVSQIYYKTADADIFFISNYHLEQAHVCTATFNVQHKVAWLWDPETGNRYKYPVSNQRLRIDLDPAESKLFVFTDADQEGESYAIKKASIAVPYPITGPWQLTLQKVDGSTKSMELKQLIDFKDDQELQSFAGMIWYEKELEIKEVKTYNYFDLGKIRGISEVELNGIPLGCKWHGQHRYDLNGSLKIGKNTIKIKITTVLGNYAKSLQDNPVTRRWTTKQPLFSMGLVGPVQLV
ncbi:glycosyl hydrolase [Olivibacter ginsenosidimutans]|uniref:Glycosyl hydrolase n=1 Tax=Olivibacter ginsenosidimutans TaxID=1176537 RepID=A0ABP9AG86_9SPHI